MSRYNHIVTLAEVPGRGWLWREHGRYFAGLTLAVRAVRKDAAMLAHSFDVVLTNLTYEPCSPVGAAIVRAVAKMQQA